MKTLTPQEKAKKREARFVRRKEELLREIRKDIEQLRKRIRRKDPVD